MKKPPSQGGRKSDFAAKAVALVGGWYILAVSDSLVERGEWLVWKKKLMKALLTLFWTVLMLVLLTTKAC